MSSSTDGNSCPSSLYWFFSGSKKFYLRHFYCFCSSIDGPPSMLPTCLFTFFFIGKFLEAVYAFRLMIRVGDNFLMF